MKIKLKAVAQEIGALATMGLMAIVILLVIQIIVLVVSVTTGIIVGSFTNWMTGIIAGLITFAGINKIFYLLDLIELITGNKSKSKSIGNQNTN
jgi:hypothetical protein